MEYDGLVFAYALSRDWLTLKLFRLIPLARVRLAKVIYIRQRVWSDVSELAGDAVKRPFRSWYWPHPIYFGGVGRHAAYVIGTEDGTQLTELMAEPTSLRPLREDLLPVIEEHSVSE